MNTNLLFNSQFRESSGNNLVRTYQEVRGKMQAPENHRRGMKQMHK